MYVRTATTRYIDTDNLATASRQEVYDTIARHMLSQNRRCVNDRGDCKYLMHDDAGVLRCAAGCLISSDRYTPAMENKRWNDLTMAAGGRGFGFSTNHLQMIQALQDIHDCKYIPPSEWPGELRTYAAENNLIPFSIVR